MFPAISGLNSLNVFDLRRTTPAESASVQVATNPFLKQAVSSTAYSLSHPRCGDSPGVANESKLAKRLDFIS